MNIQRNDHAPLSRYVATASRRAVLLLWVTSLWVTSLWVMSLCGLDSVAHAATAERDEPLVLQTPTAFYNWIAINVAHGETAQWTASDNVAGYYETRTGGYNGGVGYRYREHSLFFDFASALDEQWLDRRVAARHYRLLPNEIENHYDSATESLQLQQQQSSLSLRLRSETPRTLTLAPLLPSRLPRALRASDDTWIAPLMSPCETDVPCYVAISSPQKINLSLCTPSLSAQSTQAIDVKRMSFYCFRSASPQTELLLHVAFANSERAAKQIVQTMNKNDRWNESRKKTLTRLTTNYVWTDNDTYNRALMWSHHSAQSFVVQQYGDGIWAGLPWFRDNWGRDTFIALPGTSLVSGHFDQAKAIIDNFLRWQKNDDKHSPLYGRIPNRVAAEREKIYNTVDGTPWLIRALYDYVQYSGDKAYALAQLPRLETYLDGVEKHWLDDNGLITHDDADTWMDARIEGQQAWSPRGNRAVEIQALWCTALDIVVPWLRDVGQHKKAQHYAELAQKNRRSVQTLYWDGERLADRLRADNSADFTVRPNQLLVLTVPVTNYLSREIEAAIVRRSVAKLLLPYGVLSLDPAHPAFHPRHQDDEFYHKDAAYHNGTIWGWNAGFAISALNDFGQQNLSWSLTKNLSDQLLQHDARGSMSELIDATLDKRAAIKPSGTFAQSWSVAEFSRNAFQDYLGFQPALAQQMLHFMPAIPDEWQRVQARVRVGKDQQITLFYERQLKQECWRFNWSSATPITMQFVPRHHRRTRKAITLQLRKPESNVCWSEDSVSVNGERQLARDIEGDVRIKEALEFTTLNANKSDYPVLKNKNVLRDRLLKGESVF